MPLSLFGGALWAPMTNGMIAGRVDSARERRNRLRLRYAAAKRHHLPDDGDVPWALSTHEVENDALLVSALSSLAAEIAWDAVLSSVDRTSPSEL